MRTRMLVALCALATALITAGCTSAANQAGTSPHSSPTGQSDELPSATTSTDGPDDPTQQTQHSGPIAEYGGPPYGVQGDPEVIGSGRWCATVGLFWGGEAPPQHVSFTITGVQSDPRDTVSGRASVCGSAGATQSCIGFTMLPDTPFTVCSLELDASTGLRGTAQVTFTGTLDCDTAADCDAAIARKADPGPPIVVTEAGATATPEPSASPEPGG